MMIMHKWQDQKGTVLVIALVLISVATVVTMNSMRGSVMQEKMAANHKLKATSLMAAESGVASFIQWVNDPATTWNSATWQKTIPTTAAGKINLGSMGYYWIDPSDVIWGASSVTLKVRGYAKSDNTATANANTIVQITVTKPVNASTSTAIYIGSGMMAEKDITIKGNATITGSILANGNIKMTSGNNVFIDDNSLFSGTVSAHGTAQMKGKNVDQSLVISGAAKIVVPSITDDWLTTMRAAAAVQSCNMNLSGDQGGKIYYCNGDATLAGTFSNATIVTSGNLTTSASGTLGGSGLSNTSVTVAIVAKGNIISSANKIDNSAFWTNGNYEDQGSGSVTGAIVAGGNITRQGNYTFLGTTPVQNDYIVTAPIMNSPSRITLWQEALK